MQTPVGSFVVVDSFWINNLGWVLTGEPSGQVAAGNQLVFPAGTTLLIKSVEVFRAREGRRIGLVISRSQVSVQRDFLEKQVIGLTAHILAQNA
ncbi:hypothetical protein [Hymenobacter cellulosilyticus]|uniref:Uncharacterized protein n=1 Tax=Hymenobacter cellulosilyticus TaxID=2932248 RepID=A0A8T9Q5D6_9BACT|nr:hypothetical protein [Hymenobacter cellulosilyticus]UOQ72784.1 hypothetical protein MUN79_01975 [Hymenobacter cellulosilyticus]